MKLFRFLKDLFSSQTLSKVDFYSIRFKIAEWSASGNYPGYYDLPPVIVFPSEFWEKVTQLSRHTMRDGHERAVTVWWADGEFVLTEAIRGDTQKVSIPESKILVEYRPVAGTNTVEKIVTVNGKVYARRKMFLSSVSGKKKLEVMYLFNLHTHPPHRDEANGTTSYSLFSRIDIESFIGSPSSVTGVVTDELWLLFKTNSVARSLSEDEAFVSNPEHLTKKLGFKVYRARFGGGAVVAGIPRY